MKPTTTRPATASDARRAASGGTVTWACHVGFPPATIFPLPPPERMGIRNLAEFQTLMYRPLYWLGRRGQAGVDYDLSLARPPQWSGDGRSVTVTVKPWRWSNGETVCADNIMLWMNLLVVKKSRYGRYTPGYLPDNLTSYQKVAPDAVRFTFDKPYSKTWVLMNQLALIVPMPRAWDRTAPGVQASASYGLADVPAVYDYLAAQNGPWTQESNEVRTGWPDSPVWSVVNGPWRLKSYALDGTVTFVPNEHYSGPHRPYLEEFRQVPASSDEAVYQALLAGPEGPGAIGVGYLPHGMDTGQDGSGQDAAAAVAARYRLIPQDICLINYMLLNFANPATAGHIIRQAYFRQALQCALDQDTAVRDIFGRYGHRTSGPVPAVPDPGQVSPALRGGPVPFDIGRARRLLTDHGWDVSDTPGVCRRPGAGPGRAGPGIEAGDRLSFSMRYAAGRGALTHLMHQFRADAARAGIELRLEEVDGSVMVGRDHTQQDSGSSVRWELQCWNGGWVFKGHPTGEALFRTGAGSNFGRYSDPEADRLIDQTVLSDDISALYEYQDYIASQVPVLWAPGFPLRVFAVARNLHGISPVNPYGLINPENWYYAEEA